MLRRMQIDCLRIQAIRFKLADNTRYTPDFTGVRLGQLVAYEVKGFMRDDAAVKLKVVARQFTEWHFVLVTREKGQWVQVEVKP